jgi:tetratricopeptide (TPR) repeat protein
MMRHFGAFCLLLALASAALLIGEIVHWTATSAYNEAIANERFADIAGRDDDVGLFAAAYAAQRDGRFQEARVIYAKLEHSDDESLRAAAFYNTGNSYLQQVATINRETDEDLALPLIELAKGSYRDALRIAHEHWGARYNLERALQWLPDTREREPVPLEGRPGTIRTILSGDTQENLP